MNAPGAIADPTRIVVCGGQRIALGMEWEVMMGTGTDREQIKSASVTANSDYYARSRSDGKEKLLGFVHGVTKQGMRGKTFSAAQSFASMGGIANNAFFIWDFPDGKTWVCQARDGYPVIGNDILLDQEDAVLFVENQITVTDSTSAIEIYGNNSAFKVSKELNLEDIAKACGKDDEIKRVASFNITSTTVVYAVLGISLIGGTWYYFEQQRIMEERKRAAQAARVDPNIQYEQALKAANPGMSADLRWKSVRHVIDEIPTHIAGWKFQRADCKTAPEHTCNVTWERISGTNAELAATGLMPVDTAWSADGRIAQYTIDLPEEKPEDSFEIAKAPPMKSVMMDYVSLMQDSSRIGLRLTMDTMAPWSVPSGVSFGEIRRDLLVSSGKWQAEGSYWMSDIAEQLPKNFTINEFTVTYTGGNIDFNMKGNYYAKN